MNSIFFPRIYRAAGMDHDPGGSTANNKEFYDHIDSSNGYDRPNSFGGEFRFGGEFSRTIEVRDSTERAIRENPHTNREYVIHENYSNEQPEKVSPGRDSIARSPIPKEKESPLERVGKNDRNPESNSAKVAQRVNYIISKGYVEGIDEAHNLIRCGNITCQSFGPSNQGKELKKVVKEMQKKMEKLAKKIIMGKSINPYKEAAKAMLKPSKFSNDETDFQQISRDLDMFIFKKEHPDIVNKYLEFKLKRFPDLKTPDELNHSQLKQQSNYIDNNVY